jgi:hypothetical protein
MTGRRIAGRTEQGAVGKGNTLYPTLYALRCTLPLSSAGRPGFLGNVNEELVIFSPVPVFVPVFLAPHLRPHSFFSVSLYGYITILGIDKYKNLLYIGKSKLIRRSNYEKAFCKTLDSMPYHHRSCDWHYQLHHFQCKSSRTNCGVGYLVGVVHVDIFQT